MTTRTPPWAKGMRKLGPGIYLDGNALHFCELEICQDLGVKPTEQAGRIIEQTI
jgi:hypothetical protein